MKILKQLKGKNVMLNLGVPEGQCFKNSILAAIYRNIFERQEQALAKKKFKCFLDNIKLENISEPANTNEDIIKFKQQNPKYVVTVFQ